MDYCYLLVFGVLVSACGRIGFDEHDNAPAIVDAGSETPEPVEEPSDRPPGAAYVASRCPAPPACGENILGRWFFTEVCIEEASLGFQDFCPQARLMDSRGTVEGSIRVDATILEMTRTVRIASVFFVPDACNPLSCQSLAVALASEAEGVGCEPDVGGCRCNVPLNEVVEDVVAYTTDGTTLSTADGRQFTYCAGQESGSFREADAVPMAVYTLSR